MNTLWRLLKQHTWLMLLPLFLTAYGSSALAAQTPSFSATSSGTANNLTLTANINVADADAGRSGNTYLGVAFNQVWYFNNGVGWAPFYSGPIPAYAVGSLANRTIEVAHNEDLSSLVGAQLYVGYGLTESDMLNNGKYGMVYTLAADTTAPTVTGTIHSNGATNVAVNSAIGATFSEEMTPSTITNTNFTLKETVSGTAVAGVISYSGVSAVFTPSNNLAAGTNYTVTVKGGASGVKDLAGNALANDFVIRWTTSGVADTTAPTITGTVNANGAYGVPINTAVGATFSEWMNPLTITSANFTLREAVSGAPVAGTVSYSGVNAVFTPASNLANGLTYTVTIKGGANGVKDLAGNALASDYSWGWWTYALPVTPSDPPVLDTTAPTVTGTINANGATNVAVNTAAGITFSEPMAPLTMTNVNFTLKETVSGAAVAGTISYSGVNAAFVPLNNLTSNTSYTVTVKSGSSGVKDLAGNALASDYVISWTTAAAADITAPTVSGTTIANGAANIAINTAVGATFNEGMAPLTMTNVNFTLRETVSGNPVAGLISFAGGSWVFTPSNNLTSNLSYTATIKGGIDGVTDLAIPANALAIDYVWSFTTASSGPLAVNLLSTSNFAILAKTAVTDVPSSAINGNIGLSPAAGSFIDVTCAEMTGTIYTVDATYVGSGDVGCVAPGPGANKTLVDNAILDMGTAYADAAGRTLPDATELGSGNISGLTITPGLYKWSTDVAINTDVFLSGGANDVWIFQIAGDLSIASGGSVPAGIKVILSGGAQAKNIFWQVGGLTGATLGTYSTFNGNILSAKQVILRTGAVLNGRAFSDTQVVLDQNPVTKPAP